MLVRHIESFSSSTFTKMISDREAKVKQLLYDNANLVLENRKFVSENAKKMYTTPNENKVLLRLFLNKSYVHIENVTNTIHALA